ncbi:MAG: hypothetical protein LBQ42_13395 [Synergistaceae bacterium]|jgi:tetratricopeptide (TPR) repeat protein|nr:hypothetical protein [Synergistaceae bacterium]
MTFRQKSFAPLASCLILFLLRGAAAGDVENVYLFKPRMFRLVLAATQGDAGGFRGASTLSIQKAEEGADSEPRGRVGSAPLSLNAYKNVSDIVGEFLPRTPLSATERADILEAIRSASSPAEPSRGRSKTEWLITGDGKIYSLVLLPVQKDARAGLQVRLEEAARTRASLRAHYLLYLKAMPTDRKRRYAREESVAEALAEWDKSRGENVRLKLAFSIAITSEDWAFALLRADAERLNAFGAQVGDIPENALDTAYCAVLYPKAAELFGQRRYKEALLAYQELHDLRWAQPVAYLDAAECFLFTGDKENAARLAREAAAKLDDAMDSALLKRAGDILLESGEEASAEQFYRRAIEKFRQEP